MTDPEFVPPVLPPVDDPYPAGNFTLTPIAESAMEIIIINEEQNNGG